MKVIMYGAEICINCLEAKEELKDVANLLLEYRNITESTTIMKEFLAYRDNDPIFNEVKEAGRIGIPFFVLEDGRKTFDTADFTDIKTSEKPINACSLDGKGNC